MWFPASVSHLGSLLCPQVSCVWAGEPARGAQQPAALLVLHQPLLLRVSVVAAGQGGPALCGRKGLQAARGLMSERCV
jgi:hypothetical protein